MPHLRAAYETYQKQGFEILSVSLDSPQRGITPEKLAGWTRENGMVWRHIYDQQAFQSPLAQAFHVNGIPSIFLIGRDGRLAAMGSECRGEALLESVRQAVEKKGA